MIDYHSGNQWERIMNKLKESVDIEASVELQHINFQRVVCLKKVVERSLLFLLLLNFRSYCSAVVVLLLSNVRFCSFVVVNVEFYFLLCCF